MEKKLPAGDMSAQQHEVPFFSHPSILSAQLLRVDTIDLYLQMNPEDMEEKLSAGDMFFSHPSILVSSLPTCIPLWLPSLPPLQLLPPHSAPRHHHHHQPCQQLYPHQPLALASRPLPSADLAEELVDFASRFKHWRVRLGFTQREVGLALNISQPTISNFENLNLSLKSMHKMKPKLENWLDCEQRRSISAATFPPRL